jgi:thiol-disulfide isomerase/thioredoxin
MKKIFALASILLLTLSLAACATGGISSDSGKAFISGNGAAIFIAKSERRLAPGETLNGDKFEFQKGKVTVVNVWASWCSPCRAEAPTLQEFATKNPQIQFIGILTRDNFSSARSFVQRFKITYPTLIDDAIIAGFRGSLPANAIPTTLILDDQGRVAARVSGLATVSVMKDLLSKVSGGNVNV